MSVKGSMRQYFLLRESICDEGSDLLFRTPFDEDVESPIYFGEVDDEDYIGWKPVIKKEIHDFAMAEKKIGVKLHKSMIEYFNSYWFADMDGFIKTYYIILQSIRQREDIESYLDSLSQYMNNHGNTLQYIPIGIEGNGRIVVIDNQSGFILLEDYERGSFELLSTDLRQLIINLRL